MLFMAWTCCDGARAGRLSFAKADSLLAQHAEQVRQNTSLQNASYSQLLVTQRDLVTEKPTAMIALYYQPL